MAIVEKDWPLTGYQYVSCSNIQGTKQKWLHGNSLATENNKMMPQHHCTKIKIQKVSFLSQSIVFKKLHKT